MKRKKIVTAFFRGAAVGLFSVGALIGFGWFIAWVVDTSGIGWGIAAAVAWIVILFAAVSIMAEKDGAP
jgi:uncharacterized membrane protein